MCVFAQLPPCGSGRTYCVSVEIIRMETSPDRLQKQGRRSRERRKHYFSLPPPSPTPKEEVWHSQDDKQFIPECNNDPINYKMFSGSPMYLSTLMNNRCRHEALRNTSVRKMVLWHNSRPYCRLGPYFWVMAMRGKMTTPTGKSAKARLTIKALVAERSFLLITTASMTKPLPEERRLWQQLLNNNNAETSSTIFKTILQRLMSTWYFKNYTVSCMFFYLKLIE